MQSSKKRIKTDHRKHRNELGLGVLFDLENGPVTFNVTPNSKFWRLGIRFSKGARSDFYGEKQRYDYTRPIKHVEFAVGHYDETKNEWGHSHILEFQHYYLNFQSQSYKYKSNTEFEFTIQKDDSKVFIVYKIGSIEVKVQEINKLDDYRYFKIFVWAEKYTANLLLEYVQFGKAIVLSPRRKRLPTLTNVLFLTPTDTQYIYKDELWDSKYYKLHYCDIQGEQIPIGSLNVSSLKYQPYSKENHELPETFNQLKEYFTFGLDINYYTKLKSLGSKLRIEILTTLNDIAFNKILGDKILNNKNYEFLFVRKISKASINGQFRRVAHGKAELSAYNFSYEPIEETARQGNKLIFQVVPESTPPTNIHAIIGKNGAGKTFILRNLIMSLFFDDEQFGKLKFNNRGLKDDSFAGLVYVLFSSFEDQLPELNVPDIQYKYNFIGTVKVSNGKVTGAKKPEILKREFVRSVQSIRSDQKIDLWCQIIALLEVDEVYRDLNLQDQIKYKNFGTNLGKSFRGLSSGHKIVLLTLSKLVETVEEKTLVIIDEPESHLHPPLLANFIRALSILLIERNAVAVLATHSPVVLQEIPKSCVWKIHRSGNSTKFSRLKMESFGEAIGVLTHDVFGLEVFNTGYIQLLKEALDELHTYDAVVEKFDNQLGMEARAILRGLSLQRNNQ